MISKVVPTPRALSAYDARRQMLHQMDNYQMDNYQMDNFQQQQRLLNSPSNVNYTVR